METLQFFLDDVGSLDSTVWTIAVLMSLAAGVLVHNYVANWLFSTVITSAMCFSILVGTVCFNWAGVDFVDNKDANAVAAAGMALCTVAAITVLYLRLLAAIGDWRQKHRRYDNAPSA